MSLYPYNVTPQQRSPHPTQPTPCLRCPPDDAIQAIMFDNTTLAVIKGWETKSTTDLREFFHPIESYLEYQVTLKPMTSNEAVTLSYGMLADPVTGDVPFLAILPMWQYANCTPDKAYINWRFKGYAILRDANENGIPDELEPYGLIDNSYTTLEHIWDELGRIMIISAGAVKGVRPIELQNLTGQDVMLKILIGK